MGELLSSLTLNQQKAIAQECLALMTDRLMDETSGEYIDASEIANILLLINQLFCETLLNDTDDNLRILGFLYAKHLQMLIVDIHKKYVLEDQDANATN